MMGPFDLASPWSCVTRLRSGPYETHRAIGSRLILKLVLGCNCPFSSCSLCITKLCGKNPQRGSQDFSTAGSLTLDPDPSRALKCELWCPRGLRGQLHIHQSWFLSLGACFLSVFFGGGGFTKLNWNNMLVTGEVMGIQACLLSVVTCAAPVTRLDQTEKSVSVWRGLQAFSCSDIT